MPNPKSQIPDAKRLIVGLGNPGTEYGNTRHNIGFMAIDAVAGHYNCGSWKKKFKGQVTAHTAAPAFILLKPQTYMNLSGESVAEAMRFYQLTPEDIIVFHDDLDLQPGHVKIKQGGGTGGHKGLKSIDAHIGQNYCRVRLGIGHPGIVGEGRGDAVSNYVLHSFAKSDKKWLETLMESLSAQFNLMLEGKHTEYAKYLSQKITP